jgi:hypothetical protein
LLLGKHSQVRNQQSELIRKGLIPTFRVLCDCPPAYHSD